MWIGESTQDSFDSYQYSNSNDYNHQRMLTQQQALQIKALVQQIIGNIELDRTRRKRDQYDFYLKLPLQINTLVVSVIQNMRPRRLMHVMHRGSSQLNLRPCRINKTIDSTRKNKPKEQSKYIPRQASPVNLNLSFKIKEPKTPIIEIISMHNVVKEVRNVYIPNMNIEEDSAINRWPQQSSDQQISHFQEYSPVIPKQASKLPNIHENYLNKQCKR